MNSEVATDLTEASADFIRVVWPAIKNCWEGGELFLVESTSDAGMNHDLDAMAGIDAWLVCRDRSIIYGLAIRVQWEHEYRSFTIRRSRSTGAVTEYKKRREAIKSGHLYPGLTIQAYVSERGGNGHLVSCAIIRTADLYEYVGGLWATKKTTNSDGNTFWVCYWERSKKNRLQTKKVLGEWSSERRRSLRIVNGTEPNRG